MKGEKMFNLKGKVSIITGESLAVDGGYSQSTLVI
jgi:hypothetical protein